MLGDTEENLSQGTVSRPRLEMGPPEAGAITARLQYFVESSDG
jgi:hypothetical protein